MAAVQFSVVLGPSKMSCKCDCYLNLQLYIFQAITNAYKKWALLLTSLQLLHNLYDRIMKQTCCKIRSHNSWMWLWLWKNGGKQVSQNYSRQKQFSLACVVVTMILASPCIQTCTKRSIGNITEQQSII